MLIVTDVGNKAAVFPLQLLGFDVDFVNSVQFSNHTGYQGGFEGDVLNGEQLVSLLKGLERNSLLGNVGHLLTGYIGSETFLRSVLDVLKTLRRHNPDIRFVCDPVLGDSGKFYVPPSLVPIYRDEVFPFADIVTPNQFEVEQLTGIRVKSISDAKSACKALHVLGPQTVLITSAILDDNEYSQQQQQSNVKEKEQIVIIASQRRSSSSSNSSSKIGISQEMWCVDCPMIPGNFTGTGDLCAALLLAWSFKEPENISFVLEKVISTMYSIIKKTVESAGNTTASQELKLIQSKTIIENPPSIFKARQIS